MLNGGSDVKERFFWSVTAIGIAVRIGFIVVVLAAVNAGHFRSDMVSAAIVEEVFL